MSNYSYDHLFGGLAPEEFLSACSPEDRELLYEVGTDNPEARTFTIPWPKNEDHKTAWVFRLSDQFVDRWYEQHDDLTRSADLSVAMISNPHLASLARRWQKKR